MACLHGCYITSIFRLYTLACQLPILYFYCMLKPTLLVVLICLCGLLCGVQAQVFSVVRSEVSFQSDAPHEILKASASNAMKGIVDFNKRTFAFTIPMKSFDGFNSSLQKEHFNENYMESEKYPAASFSGRIIEEEDFSKDGAYTLRAKGKLFVHGIAQERIIKCDITIKNGNIKVKSFFTVLLADHEIKVPRIVHEKLASEIKINLLAELTQK
ncbi:MAG: YceI family protein [Sphingobacteriales bacterium]|nr:MAG: YceI family protein [Sphingobacteriales bacterium]